MNWHFFGNELCLCNAQGLNWISFLFGYFVYDNKMASTVLSFGCQPLKILLFKWVIFSFVEPFYYVPLCIDGLCNLYILVHTILYINGLCCVFFMGCYIYSPYHCDILIYYLLQCLKFLEIQFNALLRMCLFIHEISKQSIGCILLIFLNWWTFYLISQKHVHE